LHRLFDPSVLIAPSGTAAMVAVENTAPMNRTRTGGVTSPRHSVVRAKHLCDAYPESVFEGPETGAD